MATITGTSGNDTLTTNLDEDADIFGMAGDDLYKYLIGGWDDTITDTGGDDELEFGTGIDYKTLAFGQDGDNLVIYTYEAGTITINDQFLSSSDRIELLSFIDSAETIDLTHTSLLVSDVGGFQEVYGTSGDDLILGGTNSAQSVFGYDGNDIIYAGTMRYAFGGDDDEESIGGEHRFQPDPLATAQSHRNVSDWFTGGLPSAQEDYEELVLSGGAAPRPPTVPPPERKDDDDWAHLL